MRQKSAPTEEPADQVIKGIGRATRRHFSAEDMIPEGVVKFGDPVPHLKKEGRLACPLAARYEIHFALQRTAECVGRDEIRLQGTSNNDCDVIGDY